MSKKKNEDKNQVNKNTLDWLMKNDKDFLMSYYVLLQFYDSLTNFYKPKKWKNGKIVLTPKSNSNVKAPSIGIESTGEGSPSSQEG